MPTPAAAATPAPVAAVALAPSAVWRRSVPLATAPPFTASASVSAATLHAGGVSALADGRPYESALQPGDQGPVPERLGPQPIRVVLVEDVPEVVEHVRELLRSQSRFKLVQAISDGGRAVDEIRDPEPDVVLVDALLQGRTSGATLVTRRDPPQCRGDRGGAP